MDAQCSKVSRCGFRKEVAGTRTVSSSIGKAEGIRAAQTKGFTIRTLCLPHETPSQTPCPEDRMSRGEKLPRMDLRAATNRRAVSSLFQPRLENGRVFPRYGPLCHGLRGISHFEPPPVDNV